ncbi:Thymidine kinase, partial [uncultured Rubrobacteraceae bacterium]
DADLRSTVRRLDPQNRVSHRYRGLDVLRQDGGIDPARTPGPLRPPQRTGLQAHHRHSLEQHRDKVPQRRPVQSTRRLDERRTSREGRGDHRPSGHRGSAVLRRGNNRGLPKIGRRGIRGDRGGPRHGFQRRAVRADAEATGRGRRGGKAQGHLRPLRQGSLALAASHRRKTSPCLRADYPDRGRGELRSPLPPLPRGARGHIPVRVSWSL